MLTAWIALALAGCTGDTTNYAGTSMSDYFPSDGTRTWTYINLSSDVNYLVAGTLDSVTWINDNVTPQYVVSFQANCTDPKDTTCTSGPYRISSWTWSADDTHGTLIYQYTDETGATVAFDPPITVFHHYAKYGQDDVVTQETDGTTWKSHVIELPGECPQEYNANWGPDCVHFSLTDSTGESPLAGEYWAIPSYNVIAFQLTGDTDKWELQSASYDAGS